MDSRFITSVAQNLSSRATRRATISGLGGCGLAVALFSAAGQRGVNADSSPSSIGSVSGNVAARSSARTSQEPAPKWRLAGDVMEACRCAVTCPCNFTSDPTEVPCGSIIGWHITEGQFGETELVDLNLIVRLLIPGNAFGGGWTLGYYLDERATPPQADALTRIFGGQAGGWPALLSPLIANPLPFKHVPIEYDLVDDNVRVVVPGLLEIGTERLPNPMPGQPPLDLKVSNLAVPFYTGTADVRRSTILKLTDPDLSFEYAGRSSLIGHFEYSGP